MIVSKLVDFLNQKFPFKNQAEWDNSKLNTELFLKDEISKIVIGLDINKKIIDEAIKNKCNIIITHHPIFIDELKKDNTYILNIQKMLLENKITHIPLHTNYDISNLSMSYQITNLISNKNPIRAFDKSYGWIGFFDGNFKTFVEKLKKNLIFDYLLTTNKENKDIKTFYFGSGSCSSEIEELLFSGSKVDLFISGEIKWNIWNHANDEKKILIDIGHNIESFFINDIHNILKINKIDSMKTENKLSIFKI